MDNIYCISRNSDFRKRITATKEMEEQTRRDILAQKLLNNELNVNELKDEEIDQMLDWFKKDIKEKDIELNKIKERILKIKNN